MPTRVQVLEFMMLLTTRLRLTVEDLCLGFVIFESCLRAKPAILRTFTTRPLMLVCCAVALKVRGAASHTDCKCPAKLPREPRIGDTG